jgi:hypothetical protein
MSQGVKHATDAERIAARRKSRAEWEARNRDKVNEAQLRRKKWRNPEIREKRLAHEKRKRDAVRATPELAAAAHDRWVVRKYGAAPGWYARTEAEQGGVCAVCRGVNPNGKRLSVDHDHRTGKVRGLLCHRCNFAIGQVHEDLDRLTMLQVYLVRHLRGGQA